MTLDLSAPLRTAIIGHTPIASKLGTFNGAPAVFTRRPVPDAYPLVIVSPDIAVSDQDGISNLRPVVVRDIAAYGLNDTAANYRKVEQIGYALRDLFHRRRQSITVTGYRVIDIVAQGPYAAAVDDDTMAGRRVTLQVRLSKT